MRQCAQPARGEHGIVFCIQTGSSYFLFSCARPVTLFIETRLKMSCSKPAWFVQLERDCRRLSGAECSFNSYDFGVSRLLEHNSRGELVSATTIAYRLLPGEKTFAFGMHKEPGYPTAPRKTHVQSGVPWRKTESIVATKTSSSPKNVTQRLIFDLSSCGGRLVSCSKPKMKPPPRRIRSVALQRWIAIARLFVRPVVCPCSESMRVLLFCAIGFPPHFPNEKPEEYSKRTEKAPFWEVLDTMAIASAWQTDLEQRDALREAVRLNKECFLDALVVNTRRGKRLCLDDMVPPARQKWADWTFLRRATDSESVCPVCMQALPSPSASESTLVTKLTLSQRTPTPFLPDGRRGSNCGTEERAAHVPRTLGGTKA